MKAREMLRIEKGLGQLTVGVEPVTAAMIQVQISRSKALLAAGIKAKTPAAADKAYRKAVGRFLDQMERVRQMLDASIDTDEV